MMILKSKPYLIRSRASFTELISVLRLPDSTDPLNFSLADDTLTRHNKVRPSKDSHPKIRFWSRADYDKYIENAESGTGTRGKAPWLELEDGRPVTIEQLKAIRKVLRAAWAELVVQKLAPPTWSRICATGKKLVFDIVVKQFPLFLFDHCGWKLELLCITDYSSWRKNNLGTDRNWKDVPEKLSAKEEHIDDSDELEVDILELKHTETRAKRNGKRRLSDDSKNLVRQDRLKKPKCMRFFLIFPMLTLPLVDSALSPPLPIEPKGMYCPFFRYLANINTASRPWYYITTFTLNQYYAPTSRSRF
jgi:hypothetical protein